jgi:hypothetical protein
MKVSTLCGVENRRSGVSLPVVIGSTFAPATSVRLGLALFPVPALQTGHAELPHPASRLTSPQGCRHPPLHLPVRLLQEQTELMFGVSRLIANPLSPAQSKARQKQGAFPPPALPGFVGTIRAPPPPRTAQPDSHELPVDSKLPITAGASRVALIPSACMPSPIPRQGE